MDRMCSVPCVWVYLHIHFKIVNTMEITAPCSKQNHFVHQSNTHVQKLMKFSVASNIKCSIQSINLIKYWMHFVSWALQETCWIFIWKFVFLHINFVEQLLTMCVSVWNLECNVDCVTMWWMCINWKPRRSYYYLPEFCQYVGNYNQLAYAL